MQPVGLGKHSDFDRFRPKIWTSGAIVPKMPVMLYTLCFVDSLSQPVDTESNQKLVNGPKTEIIGGNVRKRKHVFLFFQLQESETFMPPAGCYAFPLNYFDVDGSSKYNHFPLLWCHKVLLFSDLGKQKEKEGRGNKYRGPRDWDGKWSQCQQVLDPYRFFKLGCHFNEKVPIVYGCLCFSIRVIRVCVSCTSLHT